MTYSYVERREGGYWITGTRVALDSVVYAFLEGLAPESIVDNFSTRSGVGRVHGITTQRTRNRIVRRHAFTDCRQIKEHCWTSQQWHTT